MSSTVDHPPSPLSSSPTSHTTESHLPPNPSTGAIWTELATITVAAFSEPIIARLRSFIANTPHFEQAHLQMLGPIAVRHVALMLAQPPTPPSPSPASRPAPNHDNSHSDNSSKSVNTPSPLPDRNNSASRRSFRDFAYHAVRLNKIYPETLAVEPHPQRPNSLVRKLSITSTPPSQRKNSSSIPLPSRHSSHIPRPRPNSFPHQQQPERPLSLNNKPSAVPAQKKPSPQRRKHCNPLWRHQSGLPYTDNAFPRAGYSDTLESSSLRDLKKRSNENTLPEQLPVFPNISSPPPATQSAPASQPSRLVLLRRQREKKKAIVR